MTKGQGHTLIGAVFFVLASVDQPHDWGTIVWALWGLGHLFLGTVEK